MRDIKFRVYIGEEGDYKGMHEVKSLHLGTQKVIIGVKPSGNVSFKINNKNKLLQYAGFKDKNGVEVYEGDIVEAWSEGVKGIFQIKFRQESGPCWLLWPNGQHKKFWHIHTTEHGKDKQFISLEGEVYKTDKEGFYDDGLVVLGSIYENPELLQNKA